MQDKLHKSQRVKPECKEESLAPGCKCDKNSPVMG